MEGIVHDVIIDEKKYKVYTERLESLDSIMSNGEVIKRSHQAQTYQAQYRDKSSIMS